MADNNPFKNMWQRVANWTSAPANHYMYVAIPKDHTDVEYDESSMTAHGSYFRVWLSEMFLTNRRNWFTTWYPSVHASIQLNFGNRDRVTFSHVTQAPEKALVEGVQLNYRLTELLPFNGGNVELEAELLAIKGKDYFDGAISVLQDFSGLIAAPLGEVLDIAEKVSKGIDALIGKAAAETHLALHQTFSSGGGGGGSDLKPGYIAVILATENEVHKDQLWVNKDQLHYGANGTVKPFRGYDYMLFRVEGRKERDDWLLKNIEEPMNKAIEAMTSGESEKADAFKRVALATALQSPDLALYDRRRVAQAIKDELSEIGALGLGAVGGESRGLADIVIARAMPMEVAAARGEMTFAELFE
jgi:hypothetical protein